jgi:hypothetical protein
MCWNGRQYCCTHTHPPAPVPVADSGIGGIKVDVAGTAIPAIPSDIRGAVRSGVTLNTGVEIWGK